MGLVDIFGDVKEVCCILMFGIGWADAKPLQHGALVEPCYRCNHLIPSFDSHILFSNTQATLQIRFIQCLKSNYEKNRYRMVYYRYP